MRGWGVVVGRLRWGVWGNCGWRLTVGGWVVVRGLACGWGWCVVEWRLLEVVDRVVAGSFGWYLVDLLGSGWWAA